MKMVVIGAGAMGCLLAAYLAPLTEVWLLTRRPEQAVRLSEDGIQLLRPDGTWQRIPVRAAATPAEVGRPADLALITVKSPASGLAGKWAAVVLKGTGLALTLQNGLGNLELLAQSLGPERVVQGVTAHGATLLGPATVRHAGVGATHLATRPSIDSTIQAVAALFRQAGFETELSGDLDSLVWGKLVVNAGINALTALLRVPNGQLLKIDPARQLMAAVVDEAAQVARGQGISLPYPDPQARVEQVVRATAANRSSMLADVLRAAPTEVDAINGAIVREGTRLGIDTPYNRTLLWLIEALEATYDLERTVVQ